MSSVLAFLLVMLPATPAMLEAQTLHDEQQMWEGVGSVDPPSWTPPPATPHSNPTVEQWRREVTLYDWPVAEALSVMACESGGDPGAFNASSGASGLFQFLPGTWAGFGEGDPFDGSLSIAAAFRLWLHGHPLRGGSPGWGHWECQPGGWVWPF